MTNSSFAGTAQCNPVNGTMAVPSNSSVHLPKGTQFCGFEYPVLLSDISSKCCANDTAVQWIDSCYQYCPVNNPSAFGDCVVSIHPELNGSFAWSEGYATGSATALTARNGMTKWSAVILGLVVSSLMS